MSEKIKRFLKEQGMDPGLYRYIGSDAESYTFKYIPTGKVGSVRR